MDSLTFSVSQCSSLGSSCAIRRGNRQCRAHARTSPATAALTPRIACSRSSSLVQGRRNRSFQRSATADAEPKTVTEEASEVSEEEESALEEPAPAEEAPSEPKSILESFKEAVASGDETALAAVEAQLQALDADRLGLAGTVQGLEQEVKNSKDRFLRLTADFDNFRKRTDREKLQIATNVKGDVIEALLPMVDSFERAKTSLKLESEAEERIDGAYQGIYKQFVEAMKALGVAAVETVGKDFNPEYHEAIMREDSTEYPDGIVSMEFRKGFVIGEKLVRPAMVKVSTGPGPAQALSGDETSGTDSGEISSEE